MRSSGRAGRSSGFKWFRRAGTVLVLLGLLIVIGAVVLWLTSGPLLARRVSRILNQEIFAENTRLTVGDVSGFPLRQVTVVGGKLERLGEDGWYPFVAADTLRVQFDPWALLHGRNEFKHVEATGLVFQLRYGEDAEYLIPILRPGDGEGDGIAVDIKRLTVRESEIYVDLPWNPLDLGSVSGELALRARDGVLRVEVDELAGDFRRDLGSLELSQGTFVIGAGFTMEELAGEWAGAPLTVNGRPGDRELDLTITVRGFALERLGRYLEEPGLDRGWVDEAAVRFFDDDGEVGFRWTGSGEWELWELLDTEGRGLIRDRTVRLSEVSGDVNGARFHDTRVEIPIDEETLVVEGDFEELRIQDMEVEEVRDVPGVFSGHGWILLRERDELLRDFEARFDLRRGHLYEIPFRSGHVEVRGFEETWELDSVRVELEEARLRGSGVWDEVAMDLRFSYAGDLKPWRSFLRQHDLEGTGDLEVRLGGLREGLRLRAQGLVTDLEVADIRIPRVELARAEGVVAGQRNLEIICEAPEGVWIAEVPFARGRGDLLVAADSLDIRSVELVRGDTTLVAAGSLRWDPIISLDLDRAEADLGGRRFFIDEEAMILYADRVLSTPGVSVRTPRGSLRVAGSWETDTTRVALTCELDDLDYSVFFPAGSPPGLRVGSAAGTVDLVGAAPFLNGQVDLRLKALEWEGGSFDSARVVAWVQEREIRVDRLETWREAGSARLDGLIGLPGPIYSVLEGMVAGPDPDPHGMTWDLEAAIRDVRLGQWLSFVPRPERPVGTLTADVRLGGTAATPEIRVDGHARGFSWRSWQADSLIAGAGFDAETVTVERFETWQDGMRIDAGGSFPLALHLYPFGWSLPEREMDLLVRTEKGSLGNLSLLPLVERAEGDLRGEVRIGGTPQHPSLDGWATTSGGTIHPTDRGEVVENVEASARFEGQRITIESARGELGGGTVTAEGTYQLNVGEEEAYELRARADKAVVREQGVYAARISGEITVQPQLAKDGRIYPHAEGDILVHRAEYAGSLSPRDIGQFEPQPILYTVRLTAPDKIIVSTEDVNATLGGELTVRQDVDGRIVLGELQIVRGTYRLFLEKFRVQEGELRWNNPRTVSPELDIKAEAATSGYRIGVELTGRADEPVITFSAQSLEDESDAGLTQDQIIQLLAIGSVGLSPQALGWQTGATDETGGTRESIERGLVGASGLFSNQLERELVGQLGLVDEIEIDYDETQQSATVDVRKWVTPELSVQVRQGLSRLYDQDVAIEYRLRRFLFLRGAMVRRDRKGNLGSTQDYNVDLRVRHDY